MIDKNEMARELAEKMQQAATQPEPLEGTAGLIGGASLWGLVASRLIDMMEEFARAAVAKYIEESRQK